MSEQVPIRLTPSAPVDATTGMDLADRTAGPQRGHRQSADDTLDRLATWLAEVSAEAALAGNGDR